VTQRIRVVAARAGFVLLTSPLHLTYRSGGRTVKRHKGSFSRGLSDINTAEPPPRSNRFGLLGVVAGPQLSLRRWCIHAGCAAGCRNCVATDESFL
jgi:hypothetical protein